MDIEQLKQELTQYTGERRHAHSVNVMRAAAELARSFAPELLPQAKLAGLLHDSAKRLSDKEALAEAARFGIEPSAVELAQPSLLHGKVGAALLGQRFGLHDEEVAQAIADHVTGRPNMGALSRVLYVADQIAADRSFPGVDLLRSIAGQDLELAVLMVARNKLMSVIQRGYLVEENTAALYNSQVLLGLRLPAGVDVIGEQD